MEDQLRVFGKKVASALKDDGHASGVGGTVSLPNGSAEQTWYAQGCYIDAVTGLVEWTDGYTFTVGAD